MTLPSNFCCLFFFFQAEDGIRDLYVTGVQTCALPICRAPPASSQISGADTASMPPEAIAMTQEAPGVLAVDAYRAVDRSEERRVGKECRSGWSVEHRKKKRCDVCFGDTVVVAETFGGR